MISRTTQAAIAFAAIATAGSAAASCVTLDDLRVCGNWAAVDGGQQLSGDAQIKMVDSSAARFTLIETDLFYGEGGISGQATFSLPSIAALGAGSSGGLTGEVRLVASSRREQMVSLEDGGVEIAIKPRTSALVIDYNAGMEGNVGGVDISAGEGGSLVLVPDSKTFYIGGDFLNLPLGPIEAGALGVSLDGDLAYTGNIELYDGEEWFEPTVDGGHLYLAGTIPIGRYPASIDGRAVVDYDGDANHDYILAAEGVVNLGYSLGPVSICVPVGDGALMVEGGDDGALFVAGSTQDPQWFAGTPLSFLDGGKRQQVYAHFDLNNGDVDDFTIGFSQQNATMAGFNVDDVSGQLSADGIRVGGTMSIPGLGSAQVEGAVSANGDFELSGAAELSIAGLQFADATATVDNDGVFVQGDIRIGETTVTVSGDINSNGTFSLAGSGTIAYQGMQLTSTSITVTQNGVAISANVSVPGLSLSMSGTVSGSTISMSATATKSFGGVTLGNATFTLQPGKIIIRDTYRFGGQNFTINGHVNVYGHLALSGSVGVGGSWKFSGTGVSLKGDATLTFIGSTSNVAFVANAGVKACGYYLVGKSCKSVSASINSNGRARIKFPIVGHKTIDIF